MQHPRSAFLDRSHRLALAAAVLALAACGGGSAGAPIAPGAGAFTVAGVSPVDGSRDVPLETPVTAKFSQAIDTASFVHASFSLAEQGATGPLAAALSHPTADSASLQPAMPLRILGSHTLTMTDGLRDATGRKLAGTATSFVTRDGSWAATRVPLGGTHHAQPPSLAIDGAGNAWAGFASSAGGSGTPTARVVAYDAAQNLWGPVTTVGNGQGAASAMKVASNASGAAAAVWVQLNSAGTRVGLFASTKPAGGAFSASRSISAGDGLVLGAAELAVDAAGNAVAVWPQDAGTIQASRFDAAAGSWSEPVALSTPGARAAKPQVTMTAFGDALVVWAQSGPDLVQSIRYRGVTKAWERIRPVTHCVPVSSAPCVIQGGVVDDPRIAVAPNDDVVVVWSEKVPGGDRTDVWSNVFAGNGWENPRKLTPAGGSASRPQVAMDAAANAYAVWHVATGSAGGKLAGGRIRAPALAAARASTVQDLPMADGQGIANLRFCADSRGHAIAMWDQAGAGTAPAGIWAARLTSGAAWSAARLIDTDANSPQLAIDGLGRAVAVFRFSAGGLDQLGANHFR